MPKGLDNTGGPLQAPLYRDVENRLDIVDEASDDGWANARCPAHDDENPSMGVKEDTKTGELVVNCRAGCSREKIFLSLGAGERTPRPKTKSGKRKKTTKKNPSGGKLVTTYEYRTPEGVPIALKKRYETSDGGKYFVWADPQDAEKSGLPSGLKESDLPLYNANKVRELNPKRVFFVEGEKAADALEKAYGVVAVCLPGGAGTRDLTEEQAEILRDRKVTLWPDNDPPGRELMRALGETLNEVATECSTINPPVRPKGDAYDYVEAGHRKADLTQVVKETPRNPTLLHIPHGYELLIPESGGAIKFLFENLVHGKDAHGNAWFTDLAVWQENMGTSERRYWGRTNLLSRDGKKNLAGDLSTFFGEPDRADWMRTIYHAFEMVLNDLSGVSPVVYVGDPLDSTASLYKVWPFVADDGLTILFGIGGSGKSYMATLFAIVTALGIEIKHLDGLCAQNPGAVIYVDYEGSRARLQMRIRGLLRGLDLDPDSFTQETLPIYYIAGEGIPLKQQVMKIRKSFQDHDVKLLIIDSVAKASGGDITQQETVSAYTNTIDQIGASACISVAHVTKAEDDKYPFGSAYWHTDPRLTWNIKRAKLPNNALGVLLYNRKSNDDSLKPPWAFGLNFSGNAETDTLKVTLNREDPDKLKDKIQNGKNAETVEEIVEETLQAHPEGLTAKDIAEKRFLSYETVREKLRECPQFTEKGSQEGRGKAKIWIFKESI